MKPKHPSNATAEDVQQWLRIVFAQLHPDLLDDY